MRRFHFLASLLIVCASAAAADPATPAGAAPKLEFEKYTLPNGLQVILHVDRKLPMVKLNQWYHVGSAARTWGLAAKASFVLVGDYSKIGPGLKELSLGEIVMLDTEGKPVRE